MANPNNRFLTEKDRKKAENDTANVYKQQIDDIMRGNMVAEWQPSQAQNNIKYNAPAEPKKYISAEGQRVINEYKQQEEDWRSETLKSKGEDTRKKSNNPYIRMGKHDLDTFEEDKAAREKAYDEKYPIIRQTRALIDNPIVNNTIKPLAEGLLNTAGETVGELATINNEEGKANLRKYLNEREEAQEGLGKVAYKTGEIGSNIALMSAVAPKIPGLNKLGSLTKNKYLNSALREGAENVILEGGLDLAKGDTEDFAKNRAMDFAGGALFGVGMEGVGDIGKKILKGNTPNMPIQKPMSNVEEVIPSSSAIIPDEVKVSQNLNMEPKTLGIEPEIASTIQGKTAISNMRTNTYANAEFMQDADVQKVVRNISGEYEVKTNQETMDRARQALTMDFDSVVNKIKKTGFTSAEDSAAAAMITNKYISEARETGDYSNLKDWLRNVRAEATNLGQTVQAISTWKKMTPEGMLLNAQRVVDGVNKQLKEANPKQFDELKKLGKLPDLTEDDIQFISDSMKAYENLPEGRAKDIAFAQVKQLIADKVPPSASDKVLATIRTNLLLNTKTQTRNVLGNVIMGGLENVKDVVSTPVDMVMSKITGNARTTSMPSLTEQGKGLLKGAKETVEDYKLGIDTSPSSGRYEMPNTKAFRKIENPKTVGDHLNNVMAKSERLTSVALTLGDRPFFQAAYNDSLKQQLKANKLTEPTEELIEQAMKTAEERTFQNMTDLASGMKNIQKGLNLGKDVGLGTAIMPFVKTPANILKLATDYTPAGFVKAVTKGVSAINKGTLDRMTQKEIVDLVGRGATGTALIGLGYALAKEGKLVGKGSEDYDTSMLEQQAGRLPYSIKTGNIYNTIDWAQPAAIPLMLGADIADSNGKEKDVTQTIIDAVKTGGSTLFNQSLLSGVADLFGGYSGDSGQNFMEGLSKAGMNMAGQFVPFSSALGQIASITDPNVRNTYNEDQLKQKGNQIQAKLPGISEELPKKYDTVGNEVKKNNGSEGVKYLFDSLFNPGKTGKYNPTDAEKLALDLYESTGATIQMPRVADKKINYKETKDSESTIYKLNGNDRSELQRIMGKKTEEAFTEASKSIKFQRLDDSIKVEELQKILTTVKKEAEQELLNKKGIKFYKK